MIYELAKHPEHIQHLRDELKTHLPADGSFPNHLDLQRLAHLNGVINETLRLYPAVPTSLQRLTPPEGLFIAGTFVPGNTTVWCPQYALSRSTSPIHAYSSLSPRLSTNLYSGEEAFVDAYAFIPERWSTRPELVKHQGAFAPFSIGPYGCIGRPLALLSLRTTLVRLILSFDFDFVPGDKGQDVEWGATETFTLAPGPLHMKFRPR